MLPHIRYSFLGELVEEKSEDVEILVVGDVADPFCYPDAVLFLQQEVLLLVVHHHH
jgi:hypothetical protein